MPPLSALDAILPAWAHTRHLLLDRRSFTLLLKLCAVALLAELGGGFGFNLGNPGRAGHGLPPAMAALVIPFLIVFSIVALLIGLAVFYCGSRLQFVLFHAVLRSETVVAPIWRRYGPATWRWIGLKLLVVLVALICLLPLLLPVVLLFLHSMPASSRSSPRFGPFFAASLGLLGIVVLVVFLVAALFVLLRDFGLPSMALEGTPLRETLRRIVALVRLEPGQVALFTLMRFVLGLAVALACYLALGILVLIAAVPLGGLGWGLWAMLHGGAVGKAVLIAGWIVLAFVFAALLVLAAVLCFGYGFTFLQAYAIFFLAGRYPLMASQLQTAQPVGNQQPAWTSAFYPPPQAPTL